MPRLEATSDSTVTRFLQQTPAEDGDAEMFPGYANIWDLIAPGP